MKNKKLTQIICIGALLIISFGCDKQKQESCTGDSCNGEEIADPCAGAIPECTTSLCLENITILQQGAAHGDFSPTDEIVFDIMGSGGFYDIAVLQDGEVKDLTSGNPQVNQRHNGWPAWHPSGKYIVFQSEEEVHWGLDKQWLGHPGLGFFNNLYAMTPDGKKIWKLTDILIKQKPFDNIPIQASLNPQFSQDGNKLLWTERYKGGGYHEWGYWQVKQAEFVIEKGMPGLRNITVLLRAEDFCKACNYINLMGFVNESMLLLTGNLEGQHVYAMDQYTYDLKTGTLTNLLNTSMYWEEGSCAANGKIIYMTDIDSPFTLDFSNPDWAHQPRTREYWIMDTDGSNKQRLTWFNNPCSQDSLLSNGRRTIVAECSFSKDGSKMLGIIGFDKRNDSKADIEVSMALFEFKWGLNSTDFGLPG